MTSVCVLRFTLLAAFLLFAAPFGRAPAQDWSDPPTYGSVELNAGFVPDPYTVRMTSGGVRSVAKLGPGCAGWVATAPDFDLYYRSGGFSLTISATSSSDTTLVINTPDGRWICDDDSGPGLNPMIHLNRPQSGLYDIWVGSYAEGTYADATISISELGP